MNEAIEFVHSYAGHIDEWIVIKKEILKALPSSERTNFSVRDPKTKLQRINDFEYAVVKRWEELTGRQVVFTLRVSNE